MAASFHHEVVGVGTSRRDRGSGETSAEAARRETVEETGWRPEDLVKIVDFQPMPGLVDTPHEVYGSRRVVKVGEPADPVEASMVAWVPLSDVPELIARGEVAGSGSLVGLLYVLAVPGHIPQ